MGDDEDKLCPFILYDTRQYEANANTGKLENESLRSSLSLPSLSGAKKNATTHRLTGECYFKNDGEFTSSQQVYHLTIPLGVPLVKLLN